MADPIEDPIEEIETVRDSYGNILQMFDTDGSVTTYQRDGVGRLQSGERNWDHDVEVSGETIVTEYDAYGQAISQINTDGYQEAVVDDGQGQSPTEEEQSQQSQHSNSF